MSLARFRRDAARFCGMLTIALVPSFSVIATPYRPGNDSDILERLPTRAFGASSASAQAIREGMAASPDSLDLALRLAQLEIAAARTNSDPRMLGQAEALLAPWWNLAEPPVPVLVLRATIRQSNHDFISARADLQQAVTREPNNAQAWLTLAGVQQVSGDLTAAKASCAHLQELTPALIAVTCQASIDGVSGHAQAAYDALQQVLAHTFVGSQTDLRNWATTLHAEIAERLAFPVDAERLYRASLVLAPRETYTQAAYADFLLDANRAAEIPALIAADTPVDTLLLRRGQAAHRLGSVDAANIAAELGARFAASRARGDRVHLREEARYTLEIVGDAASALTLAQENWRVQKEPLDARILMECALAAGQPKAASEVLEWLARTGLESAALEHLAAQAQR